jgi:hypothetical protein
MRVQIVAEDAHLTLRCPMIVIASDSEGVTSQ